MEDREIPDIENDDTQSTPGETADNSQALARAETARAEMDIENDATLATYDAATEDERQFLVANGVIDDQE
jgi:hypothetical protein